MAAVATQRAGGPTEGRRRRRYDPVMTRFPERPTLSDVAEAAGVSTVTVSRVLENSPKVAARTRAKVRAAMEEIGYFGNAAASLLVSGRSRTIGIVTSDTADFGYARTIAGIEQRARQRDMAVLIVVMEGVDDTALRKTVATTAGQALAGAIVIDYDPVARRILPALPAYLPAVGSTAPPDGGANPRPYVYIDEYGGSVLATQHLLELGHRSVFVLAPPHLEPVERRSRGVLDTLDAAHLPHYPVIRCSDWRAESGYRHTVELLDRYGEAVTAIACANDEIALGAVRAVFDCGLRVPEDVSVVGFDDNPLATYVRPALTTVRQDFARLGGLAFDLLMTLLDEDGAPGTAAATTHDDGPGEAPASGGPTAREPLPTELVVRESTAAPHPARGLGAG